jgi:hypothetical protein
MVDGLHEKYHRGYDENTSVGSVISAREIIK